jgi:hypothetical protein
MAAILAKVDANQDKMDAKMDCHYEKLMALMKVGQEKIEACLEQTYATDKSRRHRVHAGAP